MSLIGIKCKKLMRGKMEVDERGAEGGEDGKSWQRDTKPCVYARQRWIYLLYPFDYLKEYRFPLTK